MARSLLDLAKSMERRAAGVSSIGNESKKRKVLRVLTYLVMVTPVDTSKALSNWQLGIGSRPMTPRAAFHVGTHGSTAQASSENAINFAKAQLAEVKPGEDVYISNLMPYINELDRGHSTQHPGGFIAAARLLARVTK